MTLDNYCSTVPRRVVPVVVLSFVLMAFALSFSSQGVRAQWPYVVDGCVYDGDTSHPIVGADVTVIMHNSGGDITIMDVTEIGGLYTVVFDFGDYAVGDTIEVIASYEGREETETDTVLADDEGGKTIDVIIPYAIPQLKGTAGVMAGVFVVAVVALVALRKYPYRQ